MASELRRDYYEVLGVGPEADGDGIKRAFRSHARRFHPDVSDEPDAESRFVELVEAYEVLSNPRSRLLYDHLGFGRWRRAFVSGPPRPQEPAAAAVVAEVGSSTGRPSPGTPSLSTTHGSDSVRRAPAPEPTPRRRR